MIVAVDPGTTHSAWVVYHTIDKVPLDWGKELNETVLSVVKLYAHDLAVDALALEMVASYGMAVGASVFSTCVWAGRFHQAWVDRAQKPVQGVYRRDVKLHLCGQARAKDTNVVHALYDRYGGDRRTAVGVKAAPGPCYGMKADCWQALAVAITADETLLGRGTDSGTGTGLGQAPPTVVPQQEGQEDVA